MKINITKPKKATALQKAMAELPFDAESETEFTVLMFVEKLLTLMKQQGVNRTELAERMGVQPSRVTAMLNGGSKNFTLETQIRACHALGATLEQAICPENMKCKWIIYHEDETHKAFLPNIRRITKTPNNFVLPNKETANDDDADAA